MPADGSRSTVVLIGMMGAGKTSVGRALASLTGWPYLDNDELVEDVSGRAPREIDAADGEAALHQAEATALRHALAMPPPLIVGAAAWVVADPASTALLRGRRAIVYLRAVPQTLHQRIGAGAGRRDDATDLAWLQARFDERDDDYRALATITIDTDALDAASVAQEVVLALGIGGDR